MANHHSSNDLFHISTPNQDAGVHIEKGSSHKQVILDLPSVKEHIIDSDVTQKELLHQTDFTEAAEKQNLSAPNSSAAGRMHHRRSDYALQNFSARAAEVGFSYNDSARYSNFNHVEEIENALNASKYQDSEKKEPSASAGNTSVSSPFSTPSVAKALTSSNTAGILIYGVNSSTGKKHTAHPNGNVFRQETSSQDKSPFFDRAQYSIKSRAQKTVYGIATIANAASVGTTQLITQSSAHSGDVGERSAVKSGQIGFQVSKYSASASIAAVKHTALTIADIYHGHYHGSVRKAALTGVKNNAISLRRGIRRTALDITAREIENFYGSDDLGVESIRQPKDIAIGTTRTARIFKRAARFSGTAVRHTVSKLRKLPTFLTSSRAMTILPPVVILSLFVIIISGMVSIVSSTIIASPTTSANGKIDLAPYIDIITRQRNQFESEIDELKFCNSYDHIYVDYYGVTDNTREMLSMMAVYCEQSLDLLQERNNIERYLIRLFRNSNYYTKRTRSYTCSGDYKDDGGNWICTGHTDLYLSIYTLSFNTLSTAPKAKSIYEDPAASDFWTADKIEWCQNIYDMDWSDLYAGIDGLTYNGIFDTDLSGVVGDRIGSDAVIAVAQYEYNLYHNSSGGDKYWRWYGFDSWVNWCACFVSWVADSASTHGAPYPKFASCSAGISWFATHGQWARPGDYTPVPADLVFFDWDGDGAPDHVGIVESVSNGKIQTIEGNTDSGAFPRGKINKHTYALSSSKIYGYAVPNYY